MPKSIPVEATFPIRSVASAGLGQGDAPRALGQERSHLLGADLGLEIASPSVLGQSILLFLLIGLLASATYLVNDAVDLAADRQHPRKCLRPMAAGAIAISDGLAVAAS